MIFYFADLTHTAQGVSAPTFPLGVSYVASYVNNYFAEDCSVKIFKFLDELISAVSSVRPDILFLSNYSWNSSIAYQVAERTKQKWPDVVVVAGGPNFPTDSKEQLSFLSKRQAIDFYVQLEGELGSVEIVNRLRECGFDAGKLKSQKKSIVNTAFICDGELVTGENVRVTDINSIPSPYLSGLLDQFFKMPLLPMLETTRGCPFTCTFCSDGLQIKSRVTRFEQDRVDAELGYIATRVEDIDELIITDLNFGMYLNDVKTAKKISGLQSESSWPKLISASAGKNKSKRIIEVATILNGSWMTGASLQSTDPEVLLEIRRSNISTDSYKELIDFGNSLENGKTNSEVILGLPGDTKIKHFESLRFGIDHKVTHLRMFQAMLLMGTEMANSQTRERHQLITKFRTVAGCVGFYNIYGKTTPVVEVEEIIVGSKFMPFSDYLECRLMNLIVETFYNKSIFEEVYGLLVTLGVSYFDLLKYIFENPHLRSEKVSAIFDEFIIQTTDDLYDSEEDATNIVLTPEKMDQYLGGELGINELLVSRCDLLLEFEDICGMLFVATESVLSNRGLLSDDVKDYLVELKKFVLLRKQKIISDEFSDYEGFFYYDFHAIAELGFKIDPNHILKKKNWIHLKFAQSDSQKSHIRNQFRVYKNVPSGISRLIQRSNLKFFFRSFVVVN